MMNTREHDLHRARAAVMADPPPENPKPADSGGPLKIRAMAEVRPLRTYAAQQIDWVVDGLLAAGTVTLISGESGCGKSTVTSEICSKVERGMPFAGMATLRRPVLVLDRENPLQIVVERFDRLGISDSLRFKYWGGWVEEEAPPPWSPLVIDWVKSCEPKPLILIDSLVAFNGGDENSATEVRAYMQGFRRLADLGATVVVLHHSGKGDSAKDYRGSSDIKASIDVGYHLSNIGDASRLSNLRLRAFKARFSVHPEIVLQYTGEGFRPDSRGPAVTADELLRDLLIQNSRVTAKELENLASVKGFARGKIRQFLIDGAASGNIAVGRGQRNTQHHTWVGNTSPAPLVSAL